MSLFGHLGEFSSAPETYCPIMPCELKKALEVYGRTMDLAIMNAKGPFRLSTESVKIKEKLSS